MSKTKKLLIAAVCLVAILTTAVVGTIAWLTDKTETVKNTFSPSNIDITLAEPKNLDLKMVPGTTITKDPVVTVKKDSEACWLFVKIEKANNFDAFMAFAVAAGWTELTEGSGIYYRQVVASSTADQTFGILGAGTWKENANFTWTTNQVLVRPDVTESMMNSLYNDDGTVKTAAAPTLSFTAYACQQEGFADAAAAWTEAQKLDTNP